jgi:hypothetical protein
MGTQQKELRLTIQETSLQKMYKEKKEISDGMKADLEKVCCDNYTCSERGDRARCYLDIYRLCEKYEKPKGL